MKIVLLLFFYCCLGNLVSHRQWKVSKAMKNNLKAKEDKLVENQKLNYEFKESAEKYLKMMNIKTKSIEDLRNILYPKYEAEHREYLTRTPLLEVSGKVCTRHEPLLVRKWNFTDHKHSLFFKIFVSLLLYIGWNL